MTAGNERVRGLVLPALRAEAIALMSIGLYANHSLRESLLATATVTPASQ
jgi:hypothetical protein